MDTNLQILINAVDNASGTISGVGGSLDTMSGIADAAATALEAVGAAALAMEAAILVASADSQVQVANLNTSIQDNINVADDASKGQGAFATELNNAKTQMEVAQTALEKMTKSHKDSADQIEAQQLKVDQLTSKYQVLEGRMSLVGATASQIEAMFQPAIDAGTSMGFTVDDTTKALNTLENVLGDPKEALSALAAAQNLAREKGIDLSSAANMVSMATQGMGRGLQTVGIFLKDGIGGMTAIDAIQQQTANHAQAYADTLNGQLAVAWANINKIMIEVGQVQIPWLTDMAKNMNTLVSIIGDFVTKQPNATKELNDFFAKIGLGKDQINLLIGAWDEIALAWNNVVGPALAQLWEALKPYVPYLGEFAVVLTTGVVIALEAFVAGLAKTLTGIISFVRDGVDIAISGISSLVTWLENAVTWVEKLATSIANSGIGKIAGAVGGAIGGAIGAVASITHLASGGIVNGATLAVVGEAGPEAVIPLSSGISLGSGSISPLTGGAGGGGAMQIVVNVGTVYGTDSSAITKMMNQVAKGINTQLKLKNYV